MTAISAAIVELKAHCEHTWEVIRSLERFARVVEDAHAQAASAVQGASDAVAGVAPAPRPARPVKAPAKAVKAAPAKPNGKAVAALDGVARAYIAQAAILRVLRANSKPLHTQELIRFSEQPPSTVYMHLKMLVLQGKVQRVGHGTYRLAVTPPTTGQSSQPRPGAAAGTQAAPPVGPPSANGTKSAPPSGDFDIAWSGTKERNGQAPPILSAAGRERKS